MIQMTTVLDVADNSGAKRVFVLRSLGEASEDMLHLEI